MPQFASSRFPRSVCKVCGKPIVVMSTRGKGSVGYCSRVCASLSKFEKRYTGLRSDKYEKPTDIMRKAKA